MNGWMRGIYHGIGQAPNGMVLMDTFLHGELELPRLAMFHASLLNLGALYASTGIRWVVDSLPS